MAVNLARKSAGRIDLEQVPTGELGQIAEERRRAACRHGVDDDIGAPCRFHHPGRRQPAGRIEPVAEQDHEVATDVRCAQHHRRVGTINQRGIAGRLDLIERLSQSVDVRSEPLLQPHRVTERQERRLIACGETIQQRAGGAAQVIEPFAGDAVAQVERKDGIQRDLLERHQVHALRHAVVEHLEVRRLQSANDLPPVGDQYVDADLIDASGEFLGLGANRRRSDRANGRQRDRQRRVNGPPPEEWRGTGRSAVRRRCGLAWCDRSTMDRRRRRQGPASETPGRARRIAPARSPSSWRGG